MLVNNELMIKLDENLGSDYPFEATFTGIETGKGKELTLTFDMKSYNPGLDTPGSLTGA